MQVKPIHIDILPKPRPQINQLPMLDHRRTLPPCAPPRAISIAMPGSGHLTRDTDESTAAFSDYQLLFASQRSETTEPVTLEAVDGSVPTDFPSGTYYLAGPGLFTDDHGSTVHPLDGHGYLRAFSINDCGSKDEVKFMAKYVKTEAQAEEHDPVTDTWRFTHRGPFSVLKGGKDIGNTKVMKNVANTSVLRWGGRLMCLWEGGKPYEIESGTLDTIGMFDHALMDMDGCDSSPDAGEKKKVVDAWDLAAGLLNPLLHGVFKMPPKRILSHYKLDVRRNRLLTVSCNAEDMLLPRSNFTFYEFDSEFGLVQRREFRIPDHLMIHDWAFTDTHYILFGNRVKLNPTGSMAAMCGLSPMISALSVNPSSPTSPIYLLPRFGGGSCRHWSEPIEAPSQLWLLHTGNAFETKDDAGNMEIRIQASACSYQWFNFQKMFGYNWQSGKLDPSIMNVEGGDNGFLPHLVQMCINMDADGNSRRCVVEPLNKWKNPSDFPVINQTYSGHNNTYLYAATSSGSRRALPHFPFDMVVKLNLSNNSVRTWSAGARRFVGEPVFVPNGCQEDDGYLLVVEYAVSIGRCYLVILDAKRIGEADALVARLQVPKPLTFPFGFHGFWASADD